MIGLLVPPDRWTCPTCGETEVPKARDEAKLLDAIHRAQKRHAAAHTARLAKARGIADGAR